MNIKIAYLYYDLMNLYGESGNIKVLKQQLEKQSINVSISFLTIDDEIDFTKYDFFYMGCCTENNQKIVLNNLLKYKVAIEQSIDEGKFFLCTGNSLELFGNFIIENNKKYTGLGIFDFESKHENFRMVDEVLFKCPFIEDYVLGFQNQCGVIKSDCLNLFDVIKGVGSYPNSKKEGIYFHNFWGTYVIGPLLIRNPELLKFLVKKIIMSKNSKFKFKRFNQKYEKLAYANFLKNNYSDFILETKK